MSGKEAVVGVYGRAVLGPKSSFFGLKHGLQILWCVLGSTSARFKAGMRMASDPTYFNCLFLDDCVKCFTA